ncbi:MAG: TRAP transporter large permease subunit [Deltaproteobacteria bacterium]|nr:TRAP transporter large permease subunit [Deltaproteobacteria bacterium]
MAVTILITFFVFLVLGIPISMVVLLSSLVGILAYSDVPPLILIQQLFNGLDKFVILAVPFFILAGGIAAQGDTARRLVELMNIVFGRLRGGLAIATIYACAFFAAISGSSLATVVAIGTIMVPGLVNAGYPKSMATGIIASAGSLGVLIPPSAPLVLICVAMNTSVGRQFMAGFLPGILIATVLSIYVLIRSRKLGIKRRDKYTFPQILRILKDSILALLFPVIVLGGIYGGFTTPTEAAAVSLIYILIIELFFYKKVKFRDLTKALANAAATGGALTFIIASAGVFTWFMTTQQVPALIATTIQSIIHTKAMFLASLILFLFVAGCFMDLISMTLVLGPILIPTLALFELDLIHFGIIAITSAEVQSFCDHECDGRTVRVCGEVHDALYVHLPRNGCGARVYSGDFTYFTGPVLQVTSTFC